MNRFLSGAVAMLASVLAACASVPAPAPAAPLFDPTPIMAAIEEAGVATSRELVVRPLTDPGSAAAHGDAAKLSAQGRPAEASAMLDRALESRPDDAFLLQARAENAIVQGDLPSAERFARRAAAAGAAAGPHCRRHWETVVQVLAVQAAEDAVLASARASRDACTVAAPPRY